MNKLTILIVEDDASLSHAVAELLKLNHYKIITVSTGQDAISIASSHCPDIILLDLGLPDVDGLKILRQIRAWSTVPILILSHDTNESTIVEALDAGADDYITKPFGNLELLARIRCAYRHCYLKPQLDPPEEPSQYKNGAFEIDYLKRKVTLNGCPIHLTNIEYKILKLLTLNVDRVLSYETIILSIWGPYASRNNQILRVNMTNIRRKIEKSPSNPQYILTENGVGYRFVSHNLE